MYLVAVFNSPTMENAKMRFKKFGLNGNMWRFVNASDLSYIIDEIVAEAIVAEDTYKPKIFIVKD